MMVQFLLLTGWMLSVLMLGAGLLHLIPKLGSVGRRISDALCRAPWLDLPITFFTVAPLFVGPILGGWIGLAAAIVAQVSTVLLWTLLHELAHPAAMKQPRIFQFSNQLVGRWRNHAAVWLTAIVTPAFWIVRLAEVFIYPPITWLIDLPKYNNADWVNVSRHKFSGLVGHDLIWCLYCDWMTGVWSLGSEMLRNVESFWCPIRFRSDKKCANCSTDFPDIHDGWAPADGTMADVTATLESMYTDQHPRAWFGHPVRITVKGTPVQEPVAAVGK
ncbi:MAG: hypothetical protein H7Z14_05375 [Anaerolineae bacterium]|nr:hypothetical protein [Phycisphaerae bacterium]